MIWSSVQKICASSWVKLRTRMMPCSAPPGSKRWQEPNSAMRSGRRSEEHTSELQSLMRISYAVFCLKKKTKQNSHNETYYETQTRRQTLRNKTPWQTTH